MDNQDMLTAEINIGGEIPAVLVTGLCQVIADNGMKAVWGGPAIEPEGSHDLLALLSVDGLLSLRDDNVPWGRFDTLEKFLVENKIAFDRTCVGTHEYDAEIVRYRSHLEYTILEIANADGDPIVMAADLDPVKATLDSAKRTQSSDELFEALQLAQEQLRIAMPRELKALEPFTVEDSK